MAPLDFEVFPIITTVPALGLLWIMCCYLFPNNCKIAFWSIFIINLLLAMCNPIILIPLGMGAGAPNTKVTDLIIMFMALAMVQLFLVEGTIAIFMVVKNLFENYIRSIV